ncbi:MAG: 4-hydroxythreonine-4-phosphate dehydrogenase PdxA [Rhizobiaceae bacterium]|nr:4-hydroxythreonine-4-phosphate dehydrogenase PdxA [Rhizobiaceae bacterium]
MDELAIRTDRPVVALAMGDPSGVSPELTARLLQLPEARTDSRIVVFGDARILEDGAGIASVGLDIAVVGTLEAALAQDRNAIVDMANLAPSEVVRGVATLSGGRFALANFRAALEAAVDGRVDAVCYTPFNKKAMRMAYPSYDDDVRFVLDVTGFAGKIREFNVLERIWNARVTSHIPLKDVASHLTVAGIVSEIELTVSCLRRSGIPSPRIAVAALNPHAGDGGSFGMEEIDIIDPAVASARAAGFDVEGSFPSDTVFLRAMKEGFHAVLTMYHDQGQIAMKMMGFDKGVTMIGGLPFPLCTPAHGTAYDIAGQGTAEVGASREALKLAISMSGR